MSENPVASDIPAPPGQFANTSWTLVLSAGRGQQDSRNALEALCRIYWFPVYGYLRRKGLSIERAEDLTQSFFAWLIETNLVSRADQSRGRFRNFLIVAVRQYLIRADRYDNAAKRKPPRGVIPLDSIDAERRLSIEPTDPATPERAFEYSWAISVVEQVLGRLREEWELNGRGDRFEALKGFLTGAGDQSGRGVAESTGMSEGAVRVAVFRLKKRFSELMREEIARTLGPGEDVQVELVSLLNALSLDP